MTTLYPIKLSILVPTVPSRIDSFFPRIIKELHKQVGNRKEIEIIGLFDNKRKSTGSKRQDLLNLAQGEYLTFVDDDDRVTEDYVSSIMEAIEANPGIDCIVYNTICRVNGGPPKLCKYGIEFEYGDILDGKEWRGKPAHTMVWRSAIAKAHKFFDIMHGEDINWVKRAYKDIVTQHRIDRVLYHYDAEYLRTSETTGLSDETIARNIELNAITNAFASFTTPPVAPPVAPPVPVVATPTPPLRLPEIKSNMHHSDFIALIASIYKPNTYVELGLYVGETFNKVYPHVQQQAHGVDMERKPRLEEIRAKPKAYLHFTSTNNFFSYFDQKIDMAFIDADHCIESVLIDFANCLDRLSDNGVIFLHDTDPREDALMIPTRCGDSYKIVPILEKRNDINIITLPLTEAGLSIITKKGSTRTMLRQKA